VLGNPVEHSLSPAIHNAAFREKGMNICYTAFRVVDLPAAILGVRALNFLGLSITIPHKVAILPLLDEVDQTARRIGSVNTVLNHNQKLFGYNSDGLAALRALRAADVILEGKVIAILGSGGAARAVAFVLGSEARPAQLRLFGIDNAEGHALQADLSQTLPIPVSFTHLSPEGLRREIRETDGVIHCTPVGMNPRTNESLLVRSDFRPDMFVFDAVYNPLSTRLLTEAESAGCKAVRGVEMFLHQAALQFELWTGVAAPMETMRRVVMESLR
jgi:shikimate dehydrogenase